MRVFFSSATAAVAQHMAASLGSSGAVLATRCSHSIKASLDSSCVMVAALSGATYFYNVSLLPNQPLFKICQAYCS